mmetsp:Transcript_13289/g.27556  ORF Transcript_13289/g.27556 Transcript_13289/m.27556 type:complete len:732 (-) Transcript_13289:215-2410(-)
MSNLVSLRTASPLLILSFLLMPAQSAFVDQYEPPRLNQAQKEQQLRQKNVQRRDQEVPRYAYFDEVCTAVVGAGNAPGMNVNDTYFFGCQTPAGRIHTIEGACKTWMDDLINRNQMWPSVTEVSYGYAWRDVLTDHIELNHFPPEFEGVSYNQTVGHRNLRGGGGFRKPPNERHLFAVPFKHVGGKTIAAIRVVIHQDLDGTNITNTFTEAELQAALFTDDGTTRSVKSYYGECSRGKLDIHPTSNRGGWQESLNDGVVTLPIHVKSTADVSADILYNMVTDYVTQNFNISSPEELADHVLYCMPPGVLQDGIVSIGFADHWLSIYDDKACLSALFVAHEVGRGIGFADSGTALAPFDDQTDLMGMSSATGFTVGSIPPAMCFNAAKLFQAGWYDTMSEVLYFYHSSPPKNVTLHGFVKKNSATANETKIIVLDRTSPHDYYVAFNWASGPNAEVPEAANLITIVEQGRHGTHYADSTRVATLGDGEEFSQAGYYKSGIKGPCEVTVTVNSIDTTAGTADLSIQGCFATAEEAGEEAAEIEMRNRIKAYENALAAQEAQAAAIAEAEALGQPQAPVVPLTVPPIPPFAPFTEPPVEEIQAGTWPPTTNCVPYGGLCFQENDCCFGGRGKCKEEAFENGRTVIWKCDMYYSEDEINQNPEYIPLTEIYGGTCNDDSVCGKGETCLNCPRDCAGILEGDRDHRYCCIGDTNGSPELPDGVPGVKAAHDSRCSC